MNVRGRWRLAGLLLAALVAGAACKGGDDGSTAKGPKLSDCDYAKKIEASFDRFTENLTTIGGQLGNLDASSTAQAKDAATKAFETLDTELGNVIADLKSANVDGDLGKVNTGLIATFDDFRKQVPELKKAATAGDGDKIQQIIEKAGTDAEARLDKIEKDNPNVSKRLDACA